MRSRDNERAEWFALTDSLWRTLQAEREAWAEERKFLLNAALAATSLEFTQRQRASKGPEPIASIPVEPREPKPRAMGM